MKSDARCGGTWIFLISFLTVRSLLCTVHETRPRLKKGEPLIAQALSFVWLCCTHFSRVLYYMGQLYSCGRFATIAECRVSFNTEDTVMLSVTIRHQVAGVLNKGSIFNRWAQLSALTQPTANSCCWAYSWTVEPASMTSDPAAHCQLRGLSNQQSTAIMT